MLLAFSTQRRKLDIRNLIVWVQKITFGVFYILHPFCLILGERNIKLILTEWTFYKLPELRVTR